MVRTKALAAATCVLAALAMTGCGSAVDNGTPADGPKTAATATTNAPGSHTTIVVHDPGAQPRQQLRFSVAQGSSQHVTMTMQMGTALTVNGHAAPTNAVPPMQMGMAITVPEVSANGDVTGSFKYDELKVLGTGQVADQIRAKLAPLAKVQGMIRTTDTGKLVDSNLDIPGDVDPTLKALLDSMKEQLGNMMIPMPEEPVGVGATWTVRTEVVLGGITADVAYTMRMIEHTGSRVVLQASYVESIPEQDVDLPTLPAGARTHVFASKVTGSGRTVIDLTEMIPIEVSMEAIGPTHMLLTQNGRKSDIVQRMHMKMKLAD